MNLTTTEILREILSQRIMMLDGAMGTMIQRHSPDEAMFRGEKFKSWHKDLRGNYDLLSFTQPDMIRNIHAEYLEAGADIIETNTFSSNAITLADYDMQSMAREFNLTAVKLAKEATAVFNAKT